MIFKSKIKFAALLGLVLSVLSLILHLFLAKSSNVGYSWGESLTPTIENQGFTSKKLWGTVETLESRKPYAYPRSSCLIPGDRSNGIIYAKLFGGFEQIKSLICDLVTVSRFLNATLVIPEFQESLKSKGISNDVLPELKKSKVIGLAVSNGGCLQAILPSSMSEYQRLRCRVAFHALYFRPEIQVLGRCMFERLRQSGDLTWFFIMV